MAHAAETDDTIAAGTYRLLIGGEWVAGDGGEYPIVNPATETVVGYAPEASVAQARAAAAAAKEAAPGWAATPVAERAALLDAAAARILERRRELVPVVQAETGATLTLTKAMQVPYCAHRLSRNADLARAMADTPLPPQATRDGISGALAHRQPVGAVACVTSYNFPMTNMAGKIGPALATGNTVVIKPAPQDPLGVVEIARILDEVGFPPGVVNVVTASGAEPAAAVCAADEIDMVSFTGSTAVGQSIYAAAAPTMKRLLLELGGKSANIVFDDADLTRAVRGSASVWTFHSGQICIAPTRLYVQAGVYDAVVEKMSAFAKALRVGDPRDPATVVGPVISAAQRARIEGHIEDAEADGADLVAGGGRPAGLEHGFYVEPTLLANGANSMRIARDEVFGPVIVAIPFEDEDEAVTLANDNDFGLHGYVWTRDGERAMRVAKSLRTGSVAINGGTQQNPDAPFGGFKMSGVGRDGGRYGLEAYTELQAITWL